MENLQKDVFSNHVLMVRPAVFYGNPETAADNHFQNKDQAIDPLKTALQEFNRMVDLLASEEIEITVFDSDDGLDTPDALFPNNWFSTHRNGTVVMYPMKANNRRRERRESITRWLESKSNARIDLSHSETAGMYLEGTGSLVLDRTHRIAFAAVSERTDPVLVKQWCDRMDYRPCLFSAIDQSGRPVYHTNVVLTIGNGFTVAALSCIPDDEERKLVSEHLKNSSRSMVELSVEQVLAFAGNGLQLINRKKEPVYLLSTTGWNSLDHSQRETIAARTKVVTPGLSTIERVGGGSARCMVAELFFQK